MGNLAGFVGLITIWGLLYAGYQLSIRRYQQGE